MGFVAGLGSPTQLCRTNYYIEDSPSSKPCGDGWFYNSGDNGVYEIEMGTGGVQGAMVVTFEVGYAAIGNSNPVHRAMPDKCRWEYSFGSGPAGGITYGSEYSAVHMGDGDNTGNNINTMHGMGYMRGLIGTNHQFKQTHDNANIPYSNVVGSQLLQGSHPTDTDALGANSDIPTDFENFKLSDANTNGVTHGLDNNNTSYVWDGAQNLFIPKIGNTNTDTCGPYTGEAVTEIADSTGATYVGSSAVTLPGYNVAAGGYPANGRNGYPNVADIGAAALAAGSGTIKFAFRQAMMVIPVQHNGGRVKFRIEGGTIGTWFGLNVECPIELPCWGGDYTSEVDCSNVGVQDIGNNAATWVPYATKADALNHNFANPKSPLGGSVNGQNIAAYHVASQDATYRIENANGGHIYKDNGGNVQALAHNAAGNTNYKGVVNIHDWVFFDPLGINRMTVGWYAYRIPAISPSTQFAVFVGAYRSSYNSTANFNINHSPSPLGTVAYTTASTDIPVPGIVKEIHEI